MTNSVITVRDVRKSFRIYHKKARSFKTLLTQGQKNEFEEFEALKGVSFDVPAGHTFGLVGGNGSGKSTLLKCLAGILVPNAGTISCQGRMASLLELGSGFHPELSGRDNVFLNASILGLSRQEAQARFDDIVDFSGISAHIDSPVKNYSSGMYVRLGFSVAIHVQPDIFLVDEVLAVGDEEFQRQSSRKFAELQDAGTTIVLVTHSMGQVRDLCDSALWLDRGSLRFAGSAQDVVDQYLDEQDRLQSGTEVVSSVEVNVVNAQGTVLSDIPAQQAFAVAGTIGFKHDVPQVDLRVELLDDRGIPVVDGRQVLPVSGGSVEFTAMVPSLPVRAGDYAVRAWVEVAGQERATSASQHFTIGGGGEAEMYSVLLTQDITIRSGSAAG